MHSGSFSRFCSVLAATLFAVGFTSAQTARRVTAIDPHSTIALPGSVNPRIAAASDAGRLDPATPIDGITIFFQPTPQQKATLDALVAAQQTPGSPSYHAWITPAEYAALFGLSDGDLAQIQIWLQSQGFNIDRVANSRNSITFSGTASQVEAAFQTEMHRYLVDGRQHFANATQLAIPSALAGVVLSVRNLSDFRPHPQVRFHTAPAAVAATPAFTSAQTSAHYLTPKDVATVYDINPAYNSGYNGSGETITVVGQSAIATSDITRFQSAAGLTAKAPTLTLVPNTGTSTVSQGDEAESDLDLEYSGAVAPGATINFVYVGNSQNDSVFTALEYAVDNKLGSIINISYGACETELSASVFSSLEDVMEQAASQGQSVIAAAGDTGSTACYGTPGMTTTQQEALVVNYPASSAYAVALGGTEFSSTDVASSNSTYWGSASGSDTVSSALSYIPEQVWNDDSAAAATQYGSQYALSSGGGGVSSLTSRPTWQTGVTGIPSGNNRFLPDISLDSSAVNAGYLYCTSDTTGWSSGQKASCNSGFRDSSTQDLTIAGGTSFAAPIFSAMLAMIDQKQSASQGVASSTLYALAASTATYASAFHDIVDGTNACTAGSAYCSTTGASEYAATPGYDEATGLGSVDFNNLLTAWSGSGSSGGGSGGSGGSGGTASGTFLLTASNIAVASGSSGTSSVNIISQNSYAGTVAFSLSTTSSALASDGCYTINNATVGAGATVVATLTVYTAQTACTSAAGAHSFARIGAASATSAHNQPPLHRSLPWSAAAAAGFLLFGIRRFRSKAPLFLSALLLVSVAGFSTGCGSNSTAAVANTSATSTTSSGLPAATYVLTLTGADTTTPTITSQTNIALIVN
ncbi:MAG TPA: S53 family peptidase [Acidobacteriaceae bacterium]|jgi:subtilase family serine protease|nr:S53 family peptidase [Acidobacteriaceae bacterium]